MQRLIEFLKTRGHLILFFIIEIVAILLLYKGSNYHNSIILSSTNEVIGNLTEIANSADSYIGLKEVNVALMKRNATLEKEVLLLKNKIERLTVDSLDFNNLIKDTTAQSFPYKYITAKVVGNILYSKSNYITIDRGSDDGIKPDMGVVSYNGIVGIIETVGPHFSKVVPLINKSYGISCKVKNEGYFGSLKWDGIDPKHSVLTNLPKHLHYTLGDSVYTNGFSAIFPENIYVGTITGEAPSDDDNFYALRVKLSTDFINLKYVYVIVNYEREERLQVEDNNSNGYPKR